MLTLAREVFLPYAVPLLRCGCSPRIIFGDRVERFQPTCSANGADAENEYEHFCETLFEREERLHSAVISALAHTRVADGEEVQR